jgi:hypothetical protein
LLGVLCDIVDPTAWEEAPNCLTEIIYGIKEGKDLTKGVLPSKVTNLTGVSMKGLLNSPVMPKHNLYVSTHYNLTDLNDNGFSFKEIAEIIEEQF